MAKVTPIKKKKEKTQKRCIKLQAHKFDISVRKIAGEDYKETKFSNFFKTII